MDRWLSGFSSACGRRSFSSHRRCSGRKAVFGSIFTRFLAKAGYGVSVACDGEEALRRASEDHPDLILLDMLLPKMAGQDVLRALKANPDTAKIPVIVLSALSQKNEEKLRLEGAAAFLEKSALDSDKEGASLIQLVGKVLRDSGRVTPDLIPSQ